MEGAPPAAPPPPPNNNNNNNNGGANNSSNKQRKSKHISLERKRQREGRRRSHLNEAYESLEDLVLRIDPSVRAEEEAPNRQRRRANGARTALRNRPSMILHSARMIRQLFRENMMYRERIMPYLDEAEGDAEAPAAGEQQERQQPVSADSEPQQEQEQDDGKNDDEEDVKPEGIPQEPRQNLQQAQQQLNHQNANENATTNQNLLVSQGRGRRLGGPNLQNSLTMINDPFMLQQWMMYVQQMNAIAMSSNPFAASAGAMNSSLPAGPGVQTGDSIHQQVNAIQQLQQWQLIASQQSGIPAIARQQENNLRTGNSPAGAAATGRQDASPADPPHTTNNQQQHQQPDAFNTSGKQAQQHIANAAIVAGLQPQLNAMAAAAALQQQLSALQTAAAGGSASNLGGSMNSFADLPPGGTFSALPAGRQGLASAQQPQQQVSAATQAQLVTGRRQNHHDGANKETDAPNNDENDGDTKEGKAF